MLILIIYLLIGLVLALASLYHGATRFKEYHIAYLLIGSAIAIAIWPLLLIDQITRIEGGE